MSKEEINLLKEIEYCFSKGTKESLQKGFKLIEETESDEVVKGLMVSKNSLVRLIITDFIYSSLEKMCDDENPDVRARAVESHMISPEKLREMAKDKVSEVRAEVAFSSKCPVDILNDLSNDENWIVRVRVAKNENTPIEALKRLSNDKNHEVKIALLNNPNLPLDERIKLCDDENFLVREIALSDTDLPVSLLLDKFKNDESHWCRKRAYEVLWTIGNQEF